MWWEGQGEREREMKRKKESAEVTEGMETDGENTSQTNFCCYEKFAGLS